MKEIVCGGVVVIPAGAKVIPAGAKAPNVKLFCACGVCLIQKKFQAVGKCTTCLKMMERKAKAGGGE